MMMRAKRIACWMIVCALAASDLVAVSGPAAAEAWSAPDPQEFPTINTVASQGRPVKVSPLERAQLPRATWPAAGVAVVDGLAAGKSTRRARLLPVSIGVPAKAERPVASAEVRVVDRAASAKLVGDGVVVQVTAAAQAEASIVLDYAAFANAGGGGFGARLRWVRLPACALDTPDASECRVATPIASVNDADDETLSASIVMPAASPQPTDAPIASDAQQSVVLAAVAGAESEQGDYRATSLRPSSQWEAGGSAGTFSWSYPLRMPPVAGTLVPDLTIRYDSGSTDGVISTTNNQSSWIGEGFELEMGFIERTYTTCYADKPDTGTAGVAEDLCWFSDPEKTNDAPWDNATLSLAGHSGPLVRIGNSDQWRLKDDDGTRIQRFGAPATGGTDTTEYWKLTTLDGTQYFFGKGSADGPSAGPTNARWTVPVGANHHGEPAYDSSFASAFRSQAWRWNLDYVVAPSQDTMTVYYSREVNRYKLNGDALVSYVRGGQIKSIHYGEVRSGEADAPAAKVDFVTGERCDKGAWEDCESKDPTSDHANAWPDVPTDAICEWGDSCPTAKKAPTFFSRRRLVRIDTATRNSADTGYDSVDSWHISGSFPSLGDAGSTPTLWPAGIQHTGTGGTPILELPPVTLEPAVMRNRIVGSSGLYGLNRPRLWRITDEAGARTTVTYSGEDCTPTSLPDDPANNHTRCFPSYYSAFPEIEATLTWFTKYVVKRVEVYDATTETLGLPSVADLDLSENEVTTFTYSGDPAWHWDDSMLSNDRFRTWNEWRGYPKTTRIKGRSGAPQNITEGTWFRGMDGDRTNASGTAHRSASVTDSAGESTRDSDELAGRLRETRTLKKVDGTADTRSIYDQWTSEPVADDGRDKALLTGVAETRTTQYLTTGSRQQTATTIARDDKGQPTRVQDKGNDAIAGDESCVRTTYAQPTGLATASNRIASQSVMPNLCDVPESESVVTSSVQHFYDGSTVLGQLTGHGYETSTRQLAGSSARTWRTIATTGYDPHGRVVSITNALGETTSTAYSPATIRAARTTTVTSPDPDGSGPVEPLVTTTGYDPRWGTTVKSVAPGGQTTEATLDALGRVTAVWRAGRSRATETPSAKYTYVVNQGLTGLNAIKTETLLPDGASYQSSWQILDALLRPRQTQADAASAGSQVTDTRYDSRGNAVLVDNYLIDEAPGSTLVAPVLREDIKRSSRSTYDFANRILTNALYSGEKAKWTTTSAYEGDRTKVTPPSGGTPTTTVVDIQGRTTQLIQHLGADTSATGVATTYTYNTAGLLATMTDAKGNAWRYTYDLQGNRLTTSDPDAGLTTTTYDALNRPLTVTDARGQGVRSFYDPIGRIVRTSTLDGTTTLTSSVYDTVKPGLSTSSTRVVEGAQLTSRVNSYDGAGRETSTSLVVPAITNLIPTGLAGTYTVTTTYKPDGSVATTSLPATGPISAETLTSGYTARGYPTTLTGMAPIVKATAYTRWNTVSSLSMGAASGNAVAVMFDRDEATLRLGKLSTLRQVSGASVDETSTYGYDPAGNVIQAKSALLSGAVDNQCFQYDYQGQLKQAFTAAPTVTCSASTIPTQTALGTGPSPYWATWTTDVIGKTTQRVDRTASTTATTAYTYPGNGSGIVHPHAVTQTVTTGPGAATRSYSYDAAGNTASRPGPSGAVQTLSYDQGGDLVTVASGGSTLARMVYDPSGTRIVKRENGKTTLTVAGTELSIDNTTGTMTAARYYIHDESLVAVRTGNTNATLFTIVADHQGTTHHQIRNSDSQLRTSWQDPYGGQRGAAPTGWIGEKGFVGGTKDATGLIRIGARDYDPKLQRFTTVDPLQDLADPLQWNPYLYANNTPVTKSDPTGQMAMHFLADVINPQSTSGNNSSSSSSSSTSDSNSSASSPKADPSLAAEQADEASRFLKGLLDGLWDTGAGILDAAWQSITDPSLTGPMVSPRSSQMIDMLATHGIDGTASKVWEGITEPYTSRWNSGDQAGAIGYGTADVILAVVGTKGITKLAKLGTVATKATTVEGIATKTESRILSKVDDLPCNCFVAGTLVQTVNGPKPIEEIRPGDQVWAKNLTTGESQVRPVTGLFRKQAASLMTITLASGAIVVVTEEHPFMVDGEGWVLSGDLRVGDRLTQRDGRAGTIARIDIQPGGQTVYNFEVAGDHNYYITDAQLLVHNCSIGSGPSRLTNAQTTDLAKWLGYRKTNYRSSGQPVFTDGKSYITQDIDSHVGGTWKMGGSPDGFGPTTRLGTYDEQLNWIGK